MTKREKIILDMLEKKHEFLTIEEFKALDLDQQFRIAEEDDYYEDLLPS